MSPGGGGSGGAGGGVNAGVVQSGGSAVPATPTAVQAPGAPVNAAPNVAQNNLAVAAAAAAVANTRYALRMLSPELVLFLLAVRLLEMRRLSTSLAPARSFVYVADASLVQAGLAHPLHTVALQLSRSFVDRLRQLGASPLRERVRWRVVVGQFFFNLFFFNFRLPSFLPSSPSVAIGRRCQLADCRVLSSR